MAPVGAAPVVPDIPDRRGGWWHDYVCPVHGTQLLPASGPGTFPCPHGCVLTGEPYAGAWAVLAHQAAARSLRSLAVSSDPGAAEVCLAGLTRYAALYRELGASVRTDGPGWMLAGRMFQQALTEAIWGTSIALAVQSLAAVLPASRLRGLTGLLEALRAGATEARAELLARDDFRNNYTAWLNACGAATSRALALLGAPDRSPEWLGGPHGVAAHLAVAVYPDGWEWEGSTYYHVFVLRAYLLALRGRPVPGDLAGRLVDMLTVVATLATERGGVLPALNDTPYGDTGWDEEIYELCLLAASLTDAPDLEFLAEPLAARLPDELVGWRRREARHWFGEGMSRPGRAMRNSPTRDAGLAGGSSEVGDSPTMGAGLADARCGTRGHRWFADAGYAVLAGDGYRAVLDLGPHGGSHGHLDKLALYLYGRSARWQPAYGVPPYAHPWRRDHYRATAAHPTLTVDGTDQAEVGGRLLYWRAESDRAEVGAAAEVFDRVRFERHVRAEPGWLLDVVRVVADHERDLTLHLRTDVEVGVRVTPDGAHTHWSGDGGLTGRHTASCRRVPHLTSASPAPIVGESPTSDDPSASAAPIVGESPTSDDPSATARLTTRPGRGPADDPQRARPHLRWRTRAADAVFASLYVPGSVSVGAPRIERLPDGPTVHLTPPDGVPVRWTIRDG